METEIDVENKDLSIDPGMYANTQLQLAHVSNVLTVPVEALVLRGNHEVVYVLDEENRIHERAVQVGLQGSQLAEITSGLQAGNRVILGGQEKFEDGERVHPVFTRQPSIDVTREAGGEIDLHNEQGSEQ
jgi:multidrug efflux pump subunit AcrA (membrane-fusion protein)